MVEHLFEKVNWWGNFCPPLENLTGDFCPGELLSRIQWNHLKIFPSWRLITFSGGTDDQAEVDNLPVRFILTFQRFIICPGGLFWPYKGWQLTREVQMTSRRLTTYPWGTDDLAEVDVHPVVTAHQVSVVRLAILQLHQLPIKYRLTSF